MEEYDIVSFGSATIDTFLTSKEFVLDYFKKGVGDAVSKGFYLDAGGKIDVDRMYFASGGGGTNVAATFSAQGLKTVYVGRIGDDKNGEALVSDLKEKGIIAFLTKDEKYATSYSVIISFGVEGRTVLVYRGASINFCEADIPFNDLVGAKWFYIAPLSGRDISLFQKIVDFAQEKGIKVAANLSKSHLSWGIEKLKKTLNKIDILFINQEEAAFFTGIPYVREELIFRTMDEIVDGIIVMTKGPMGVSVSDGKNIYSAGIPESGITDRTGAGDAFGSGFVSGIIQNGDIEYAIQLGTANSTGCVQEWGAKNGLLKKGDWGIWDRVNVLKKEAGKNNNFLS